jgi:hypothetical protein
MLQMIHTVHLKLGDAIMGYHLLGMMDTLNTTPVLMGNPAGIAPQHGIRTRVLEIFYFSIGPG